MIRCIYVLTNIFLFQRPHLFYFIIRNETNSLSLNHIFTKGNPKEFLCKLFLQRRLILIFILASYTIKRRRFDVASFPRVSFFHTFLSFLCLFLSTKRRKNASRRHGKVCSSFIHLVLERTTQKGPRGDDDRTTEREGEKDGEHGWRRGRQDRRRASER